MKTIIRNVKSVKGNSLAEFATTTALMATLAATAAPKLSEMSEGAKAEKSRNEIDKLISQAGQFYQDTAESEGRGRFPNQEKFNTSIGGPDGQYSNVTADDYDLYADTLKSWDHTQEILKDLGIHPDQNEVTDGWDEYTEAHNNVWQSVFQLTGDDARDEDINDVQDHENRNDSADDQTLTDGNIVLGVDNEWDLLFGDEILMSKFQDGHYIYTVVAGGGTGADAYPPVIYVADTESVVDFNNVLMP